MDNYVGSLRQLESLSGSTTAPAPLGDRGQHSDRVELTIIASAGSRIKLKQLFQSQNNIDTRESSDVRARAIFGTAKHGHKTCGTSSPPPEEKQRKSNAADIIMVALTTGLPMEAMTPTTATNGRSDCPIRASAQWLRVCKTRWRIQRVAGPTYPACALRVEIWQKVARERLFRMRVTHLRSTIAASNTLV